MPVRFYCPAREGKTWTTEEKIKKYNITDEHFKKHEEYNCWDDKEHNFGQGHMDRLYRREFANGKYKWVKTEFLQCRLCGIIAHEGDC